MSTVTHDLHVANQGVFTRGIAMARLAKAKSAGRGNALMAQSYAESQNWIDTPGVAWVLRAAVDPMSTTTGTALLEVGREFSEYVRPSTLLGRLEGFRKVPLRTRLINGTGGTTANWVGELQPTPVSAGAFNMLLLEPMKVVGVAVVTQELLRMSSPEGDNILQNDLRDAVAKAADVAFIDPSNIGLTGVTPPSITFGVTPIASSGSENNAIQADLKAAITKLVTAGSTLANAVWIMSSRTAVALNLKGFGAGSTLGINAKGGELAGLPVYTSEHMTPGQAGDYIVLVDLSKVAIGDEGDANVEVNTQGTVQMSDSPVAGASAVPISLWQSNCAAVKAERFLNWKVLRAGAVALISGVSY